MPEARPDGSSEWSPEFKKDSDKEQAYDRESLTDGPAAILKTTNPNEYPHVLFRPEGFEQI